MPRVYSRKPLAERFWSYVDVRGPDECWPWTAGKHSYGYGLIRDGKKQTYAHRISWKLHNGLIPNGLWVLHHCDNPSCVNPQHLFLGSCADNSADRDTKGRQAKGEKIRQAKLTKRKVREIRVLLAFGLSLRVIGRKYGVVHTVIHKIKTGERWGWLT